MDFHKIEMCYGIYNPSTGMKTSEKRCDTCVQSYLRGRYAAGTGSRFGAGQFSTLAEAADIVLGTAKEWLKSQKKKRGET